MRKLTSTLIAAVAALVMASAAHAWEPSGPIKVMIGYKAGGGADTQGRLIFDEIAKRKGWQFNYVNVTGKGGANMARKLKGEPADGLTLGMAVTEAVTYGAIVSDKAGYKYTDFTYVISTAPSQMGIVAAKDKGWTSIDQLIAHAKAGNEVSVASMSPRLDDGLYVLAKKYGVKLNAVRVKGGKGSMNAIAAGDVDAGWGAGIQTKAVNAGTMVNILSAEDDRLVISPEIPTMKELGIPFSFGIKFLVLAPKGIPADAREGMASAIKEVLMDKDTKAYQFISKAFGEPPLVTGAELDTFMDANHQESVDLMKRVDAQ